MDAPPPAIDQEPRTSRLCSDSTAFGGGRPVCRPLHTLNYLQNFHNVRSVCV
jgi:hypothetical protein